MSERQQDILSIGVVIVLYALAVFGLLPLGGTGR